MDVFHGVPVYNPSYEFAIASYRAPSASAAIAYIISLVRALDSILGVNIVVISELGVYWVTKYAQIVVLALRPSNTCLHPIIYTRSLCSAAIWHYSESN